MLPTRLCVACRSKKEQKDLIRLTYDYRNGEVTLHTGDKHLSGRSCYICRNKTCVDQALKGTRIKGALDGRKVKGRPNTRSVRFPLEPQLIQLVYRECTDTGKTCQNTLSKE
ncbi:MAG: YlxR family protein [Leptolyngbya sp.]|nr:YlxR family protein [Candidatus Melainabacteria bacterium]